jgi:hypothetical protein
MSSEADEEGIDLFQEPTDFYEPEKQASFASHRLSSGQELTVRLVGHNPLWVSYFKPHHQRLLQSFVASYLIILHVLRPFFAGSREVPETFGSPVYVDQPCRSHGRHHNVPSTLEGWTTDESWAPKLTVSVGFLHLVHSFQVKLDWSLSAIL